LKELSAKYEKILQGLNPRRSNRNDSVPVWEPLFNPPLRREEIVLPLLSGEGWGEVSTR